MLFRGDLGLLISFFHSVARQPLTKRVGIKAGCRDKRQDLPYEHPSRRPTRTFPADAKQKFLQFLVNREPGLISRSSLRLLQFSDLHRGIYRLWLVPPLPRRARSTFSSSPSQFENPVIQARGRLNSFSDTRLHTRQRLQSLTIRVKPAFTNIYY